MKDEELYRHSKFCVPFCCCFQQVYWPLNSPDNVVWPGEREGVWRHRVMGRHGNDQTKKEKRGRRTRMWGGKRPMSLSKVSRSRWSLHWGNHFWKNLSRRQTLYDMTEDRLTEGYSSSYPTLLSWSYPLLHFAPYTIPKLNPFRPRSLKS